MSPEKTKILINKYSDLFTPSGMHAELIWGFECSDGWFDIVYRLCGNIRKSLQRNPIEGFIVEQVKEKFAGLRFYVSYENDEIESLIKKAEAESFRICEICGKGGETKAKGYWVKTVCKDHSEGYEKISAKGRD